jgi:hypothetical protein
VGKTTNKVDKAKVSSTTDVDNLGEVRSTVDAGGEDNDQNAEAAQIRSTIEQTRAEMSDTINALQEKLDPERISAQVKEKVMETAGDAMDAAKESVRDATIGKAERMVSNVADTISDVTGISRGKCVIRDRQWSTTSVPARWLSRCSVSVSACSHLAAAVVTNRVMVAITAMVPQVAPIWNVSYLERNIIRGPSTKGRDREVLIMAEAATFRATHELRRQSRRSRHRKQHYRTCR